MITESAHRDVCDALHRAIVARDSLRAEVERLKAARAPGPATAVILEKLQATLEHSEASVFDACSTEISSRDIRDFLAEHEAATKGDGG